MVPPWGYSIRRPPKVCEACEITSPIAFRYARPITARESSAVAETVAAAQAPSASLIGHSAPRVEDVPLLCGQGRFVDDIRLPGLLHAAFVRSPHAHARIVAIDTAAAAALPGVHAVYSYGDLRPYLTSDRIPMAMPGAAMPSTGGK